MKLFLDTDWADAQGGLHAMSGALIEGAVMDKQAIQAYLLQSKTKSIQYHAWPAQRLAIPSRAIGRGKT